MIPWITGIAVLSWIASQAPAKAEPPFVVGAREVVTTKAQREALGLKWFFDGNLGVVKDGDRLEPVMHFGGKWN